jgi:hypothetical protein
MVSIAVISFLIGTLFSMNYVVKGGDGNPWDKVWEAIYELQDRVSWLEGNTTSIKTDIDDLRSRVDDLGTRVSIIEERLDQMKTIRFADSNEYILTDGYWKNITEFTWVPRNKTSNAILHISLYAEYSYVSEDTQVNWRIQLTTPTLTETLPDKTDRIPDDTERWSQIFSWHEKGEWYGFGLPNQSNYTITVQCVKVSGAARVKNINVVIIALDA